MPTATVKVYYLVIKDLKNINKMEFLLAFFTYILIEKFEKIVGGIVSLYNT